MPHADAINVMVRPIASAKWQSCGQDFVVTLNEPHR